MTKEYFSLTALLGDVFKQLEKDQKGQPTQAFLVPKSEGSEATGQYDRLLRTKLDEQGFEEVAVIGPFLEDLLEEPIGQEIGLMLLAGDLVNRAHPSMRSKYADEMMKQIQENGIKKETLTKLASQIYEDLKTRNYSKSIGVIGEPAVLFNDFMNHFTFKRLQDKGHQVIYSPLSEYMWFLWSDYFIANKDKVSKIYQRRLQSLQETIGAVSARLKERSPFAEDLEELQHLAGRELPYYSGGNGRYRYAKGLAGFGNVQGLIIAASIYENTNTILQLIDKQTGKAGAKPVLNLTFDGHQNEQDEAKTQSFMYYI